MVLICDVAFRIKEKEKADNLDYKIGNEDKMRMFECHFIRLVRKFIQQRRSRGRGSSQGSSELVFSGKIRAFRRHLEISFELFFIA